MRFTIRKAMLPAWGCWVTALVLVAANHAAGPQAIHDLPADAVPPGVQRLLELMRDRLGLMHDVARAKWNAKRPIVDPAREEAVLRAMAEEGEKYQLKPEITRTFFAAQIAAARLIQEADHASWRAEKRGPFPEAPDLTALRKQIDAINHDLLAALAKAAPQLRGTQVRDSLHRQAVKIIAGPGITDDVRTAAMSAFIPPAR